MGAAPGEGGVPARDMVDALEDVRSILLKPSERLDDKHFTRIAGADFDDASLGLAGLLASLASTGFQASNLGDAIDVVNQMLDWRLSHEKPSDDCAEAELDPAYRESVKCKIFLGFTSNLVSSGVREIIQFLAQHGMVDVIVTTAGGIEEDLIKCLAPTYKGDFSLPGALLRSKGLNRIGNLLVPNDNYCKFENWIMPILDKMLLEQSTENVWTPSKVIARLGKEINDESSYLYWAYKNNIPVFCPALTDGSIGDMLFCHSVHNPGLIVDIVQDVRLMNAETIHATPRKTGIIILGGGLPKHHICNANMLRNGADYAVYVNTAQEFDGSDSGTRPDEAVSWGKIKSSAKTVKVHGTLLNLIPKSFKWPSSKEFVHNNYWRICVWLRRLIMQQYFTSLMTMKQVIFPTIDKCSKCISFQSCIPHSQSPNIQQAQALLLWDTTNQHFVYA